MKVPYFDLSQQTAALRPQIDEAIKRVIDSGHFVSGPEVEKFEHAFRKFTGHDHAVAVNSGTAALHLALLGAGVGPGSGVVTTPSTFVATAEAILHCGAQPIFVDIDPDTCQIDPYAVREACKFRTTVKAILPVHLYGQPAALDALNRVSEECGILLIEDACQAHGAIYRGSHIGKNGRAAAFSFYPGKNLGALGEGGIIVTNDSTLAYDARLRRSHGSAAQYMHDRLGFNYRLDEIQAAVLNVKLPYLEEWVRERREIAEHYRFFLENTPGLELQQESHHAKGSYHLFVVRHKQAKALRDYLLQHEIGTGCHYPKPLHLQPLFANGKVRTGEFPHAERLAAECVSLPIWPEMTGPQILFVADRVKAFCLANPPKKSA